LGREEIELFLLPSLSVPSSFNSSEIFNISFTTFFFMVTPNLLIRISCFLSLFPSEVLERWGLRFVAEYVGMGVVVLDSML